MIDLTLDSLLHFLVKKGYTTDLQKETNQLYTIFKIDEREYPLFLRIFEDAHQLQMMVFIPCHLNPTTENLEDSPSPIDLDSPKGKTIANLARMLHMINKELDIPGFGMDETAGVVFYRIVLTSNEKQIDEKLVLNYIKGAEQVCKLFAIPIEAVSTGQTTLDELLEKAKEEET